MADYFFRSVQERKSYMTWKEENIFAFFFFAKKEKKKCIWRKQKVN